MNIAKKTSLPPIELGYRIDPSLPVIPLAMEVSRTGCAAPHRHPRGQFIHASRGVMRVLTPAGAWVVPPSQAVWVPPQVEHEVYFPGSASLRNLFVDPSAMAGLPRDCCVLKVGPLLRELVLRTMEIGEGYRRGTPEWRLVQVVLDELRRAEPSPLHLPAARDERVKRVTEALRGWPGDPRDLAAWAVVARASARTLARLFVRDTGMTFGAWRQQLRFLEAIDGLDRGKTVTEVALALGYRSLSAFIDRFHKTLGATPGNYVSASVRGGNPETPRRAVPGAARGRPGRTLYCDPASRNRNRLDFRAGRCTG